LEGIVGKQPDSHYEPPHCLKHALGFALVAGNVHLAIVKQALVTDHDAQGDATREFVELLAERLRRQRT
jgi:hypothetical protein